MKKILNNNYNIIIIDKFKKGIKIPRKENIVLITFNKCYNKIN